jgi:hypothetical protein
LAWLKGNGFDHYIYIGIIRTFAVKDKSMNPGIAEELTNLQSLSGSDFVVQLKRIAARNEFYPYENGSDNP